MKSSILLILPMVAGLASADLCGKGKSFLGGNWYCQAVKRISYKNVGGSGSYRRITSMDAASGTCGSAAKRFKGPMAPLDEDMSLHFRGPLVLKQFAAYVPTPGHGKRQEPEPVHHHEHAQYHKASKARREAAAKEKRTMMEEEVQKRAVGDMVTATINGVVQTWANTYDGTPATPAADKNVWVTATVNGKVVSWIWGGNATPAPAAPTPKAAIPAPAPAPVPVNKGPAPVPVAPKPAIAVGANPASAAVKPAVKPAAPPSAETTHGDWMQAAYYNMDNSTAEGLTFLNNKGGQGSGVWDMKFGNSLSYAARDASAGAASPQVFHGTLKSGQEIAIFSSTNCKSANCGFVRPGSVAYQGFSGDKKAFFFEFQMPNDGTTGWNMNMPAIWALNGQIPRTQQYGSCSCWKSGCGELDIFEILDSGNSRAKTTIHMADGGGNSDYFERPTNGFIKIAVVMNGSNISIQHLRDDYDFAPSITAERMMHISDESVSNNKMLTSVFRLADS